MLLVPKTRLATLADADAIAEMSRLYVEQDLGWSWNAERVRAAIRHAATNVVVLHESPHLIGFGIMQYGDDSAHLTLLAVRPGRRRQRLGTRLVEWLEKCARTAGIARINVEARADNPGAIAFYLRLGFIDNGRVAGYYCGRIDALKMRKNLIVPQDGAAFDAQ